MECYNYDSNENVQIKQQILHADNCHQYSNIEFRTKTDIYLHSLKYCKHKHPLSNIRTLYTVHADMQEISNIL